MKSLKDILDVQAMLDSIYAGLAISRCDDSYTLVFANKGFFSMIGYTAEEIKEEFGSSYEQFIFPEDQITSDEDLWEQLAASDRYTIKYRLRHKDGRTIWIQESGNHLKTDDGEDYIQFILTNISTQKRVEEELRITQMKYEIAMEYTGITIFEYNVATQKIITTEMDFQIFGIPKGVENSIHEIVQSGIISDRSKKTFLEMYDELNAGAKHAKRFIYAIDMEGKERIIEIQLTNIFDDSGKPISAVGVRRDITEASLQERENEYSKNLISDKQLLYEVNLNKNLILSYNDESDVNSDIETISRYDELITFLAKGLIHTDDRNAFAAFFSIENIRNCFENGQRHISMEYRKRSHMGEFRWYEGNVNIIMDRLSGDLITRCYVDDITDKKANQAKIFEEKKLFESFIKNAKIAYSVNFSKNTFISGHESWKELYGLEITENYEDMLSCLADKIIHNDDRKIFYSTFRLSNVFEAYEKGIVNLNCDYRKMTKNGDFVWHRCTFHIFKEDRNGDIKGNSYIVDINEEKVRELELIYNAEHDLLTGLMNKASTERYIKEFLCTGEGKGGMHGFFFLDLDYFKDINDTFGHAFGDVVLSREAEKIRNLFRDVDIIGRVGGDEFIIFIKNIQNQQAALVKAEELCEACKESYSQNGIAHKISASIGIAFYREHGSAYEELYLHSDAALYISKENGRGCCTVYSDNMAIQNSNVNDVYENEILEPRDFKNNIGEYVFRILYESPDKNMAINSVLELIGKHFEVSRVYVFEESLFNDYTNNTFEWCGENIEPQIEKLQRIPRSQLENQKEKFDKNGIYFVPEVSRLPERERERLEAQNIKSMLQCSILIREEYKGLVGFDECKATRVHSKRQVSDMQNVANMLGVFIMEMRAAEEKEAVKNVIVSIINKMESYAYVIDPETHRMLFVNERTMEAAPEAQVGSICYRALWGADQPCVLCPMVAICGDDDRKISRQMSGSKIAPWMKVTASWIKWTDGKKMCLLDSRDITEYKAE